MSQTAKGLLVQASKLPSMSSCGKMGSEMVGAGVEKAEVKFLKGRHCKSEILQSLGKWQRVISGTTEQLPVLASLLSPLLLQAMSVAALGTSCRHLVALKCLHFMHICSYSFYLMFKQCIALQNLALRFSRLFLHQALPLRCGRGVNHLWIDLCGKCSGSYIKQCLTAELKTQSTAHERNAWYSLSFFIYHFMF